MKKVFSEVEFTFPYDGSHSYDLSKKGTDVPDKVAETLVKRYGFVSVEDVKEEAKKEVEVGDKSKEVVEDKPKKKVKSPKKK